MKTGMRWIFIIGFWALSNAAFSQGDLLDAYLNEDAERESRLSAEEMFLEYTTLISQERQALSQALTNMLMFLEKIENNQVRLSAVNRMKEELTKASRMVSENETTLFEKEDVVLSGLEKCFEQNPAQ